MAQRQPLAAGVLLFATAWTAGCAGGSTTNGDVETVSAVVEKSAPAPSETSIVSYGAGAPTGETTDLRGFGAIHLSVSTDGVVEDQRTGESDLRITTFELEGGQLIVLSRERGEDVSLDRYAEAAAGLQADSIEIQGESGIAYGNMERWFVSWGAGEGTVLSVAGSGLSRDDLVAVANAVDYDRQVDDSFEASEPIGTDPSDDVSSSGSPP